MRKEKIFEVFLTNDFVNEENWLKFILYVSKLNGIFRTWKIYVKFEKNNVRYFIKTRNDMPTTLTDLNDFLLQKIDKIEQKTKLFSIKSFYIVKSKEKSIVDIYDRNESKYSRKIEIAEIKIIPINKNNFFYFSSAIFSKGNKQIFKQFLFNIPTQFLSIDFSKHTRFLHRKDIKRYLNIEKTVSLFESDNKYGILKINAFPYLQDNYFLNLNKYDFDKHSLVIGGSRNRKIKIVKSFG